MEINYKTYDANKSKFFAVVSSFSRRSFRVYLEMQNWCDRLKILLLRDGLYLFAQRKLLEQSEIQYILLAIGNQEDTV